MTRILPTPCVLPVLQTMQQNDTVLVAMAAVFLASKSENHVRSLEYVLKAAFSVQHAKDSEMRAKMMAMLQDRQQYEWLRDIVLKVAFYLPCVPTLSKAKPLVVGVAIKIDLVCATKCCNPSRLDDVTSRPDHNPEVITRHL